jgi:hypothetical protein
MHERCLVLYERFNGGLALGCAKDKDYPAPIVDHAATKQFVLAAHQQGDKL